MTSRVAASEYALLSIAQALVGQVSAGSVAPMLRKGYELKQLRPTAMRVLKDLLAKGAVLNLSRLGGWRPARHLRDGQPVSGRLWERHSPPKLRFSPRSFELIRWLTTTALGNAKIASLDGSGPLSMGDELLFYLAADLLVKTGVPQVLKSTPAFRHSRLTWLGFFHYFTDEGAPPPASFAPLMMGEGAILLEAVQWDLTQRWGEAERSRRAITTCSTLLRRGAVTDALLTAFLQACDAANRRDLADFLLESASRLLAKRPSAVQWMGPLDRTASLRDRAEARQAAGAYLRHLMTLARWATEARSTAFFEDHYQAAQAFAARWELVGDGGITHAEGILRDLESIDFEAHAAGTSGPG